MRGFVTLAVGDERYYQLAVNLLKSYKFSTEQPLPFAIIADCENEHTDAFDKVVILKNPQRSYMDKLEMLNNAPWDENIFIDADCLAYNDLNAFWEYFPNEGVGCFGKSLEISSHDGWFEIEDVGEYQKLIDFIPQMHGGIVFFKNDFMTRKIYQMALQVAEHYSEYRFKYFSKPADEPILALCMAVCGCHPIEVSQGEEKKMFLFLPTAKKVRANIERHELSYTVDGENWITNVILLHWQNVFTRTPQYYHEIMKLEAPNRTFNWRVAAYLKYVVFSCIYYGKKSIRRVGHYVKKTIS